MVEPALKVVLGMTMAYLASFAGMFFAWYHWRRRHKGASPKERRAS